MGNIYGAVDLQVVTHNTSQRPASQLWVAAPANKLPMLDLYPNPAGDKLNVLYANLAGKQAAILIYDVMDRRMQQSTITTNANRSEINVQSLVPGLYILELRGEDGSSARKQFLKK